MKKITLAMAAMLAVTSASAQRTVATSNKFGDNWSIGINGGVVTPMTGSAFFGSMRPAVGLDINKEVNPYLGFTLEGNFYLNGSEGMFPNPTHLKTVFDGVNTSLLGRGNLSNIFCGFNGYTRPFEMEAVVGLGWLHTFGEYKTNSLTGKTGINFNFNLGESKAWTLSLKPALVYNLSSSTTDPYYCNISYVPGEGLTDSKALDINKHKTSFELTVGLTYHFMNSNGSRHFMKEELRNQAEIDGLNGQINTLRDQLAATNNQLNNANARANQLQKELTDCQNKGPKVVVKNNVNNLPETNITFAQGKSVVSASQLPNVERVATYLKNHKEATVSILGYASPEGSAEINAKIATARANAVKDILVNKYKIAENRIKAEGQGVGNMFSEPDWNRVSICTLK